MTGTSARHTPAPAHTPQPQRVNTCPQVQLGVTPVLSPFVTPRSRPPLDSRLQNEFGIALSEQGNAPCANPAPTTNGTGTYTITAADYNAIQHQLRDFRLQLLDVHRKQARDKSLADRRGYEPPPSKEPKQKKCFVCHLPRHLQRDCPDKKKKRQKGGPPTPGNHYNSRRDSNRRGGPPPPPPMGGAVMNFYVNG